jgi:hypothetical protein
MPYNYTNDTVSYGTVPPRDGSAGSVHSGSGKEDLEGSSTEKASTSDSEGLMKTSRDRLLS